MSELSRRANDVAARLCDALIIDEHNADEAAEFVEQSLLAERRLAMEEAITISQAYADRMRESLKKPHPGTGKYNSIAECKLDAAESITDSLLRAAAEKEVAPEEGNEPISKRPKVTRSFDSARNGMGKTMAREIRNTRRQ